MEKSVMCPRISVAIACLSLGLLAGSCALHPQGEREEREAARLAMPPPEPGTLAPDASPRELLDYAYAANPGLRAAYWKWVSAIEAIPQEASPKTNLAVSVQSMFEDGETSLARTTLGVQSSPMTMIPWPGKLATAGKMALEEARQAGWRFQNAKLDLRTRLLGSYFDYCLLAEDIRLKEADLALLDAAVGVTRAQVKSGASNVELLQVLNRRDLAESDLATLRSRVPGEAASINAILNRDPASPLALPAELPSARAVPYSDDEIASFVSERNPEIKAFAHDAAAREEAVKLARQQYIPDFALSAQGDLEGMMQGLMAMVTAPVLRWEAIQASIRQAEAQLEASRAARQEAQNRLGASALMALYDMRNVERETSLLADTVVPRSEQAVQTGRIQYASGRISFEDLLERERAVIALRVVLADFRIEREKLLLEIEKAAGLFPAD
jgi:cobalt-zinc-cadmium efflux system outer membrane protein